MRPLLMHDTYFVNVKLYEIDIWYVGPVVALLVGFVVVITL